MFVLVGVVLPFLSVLTLSRSWQLHLMTLRPNLPLSYLPSPFVLMVVHLEVILFFL
jgi:hypothetical protein